MSRQRNTDEQIIIHDRRVGYDRCYYLVVPDHAAGRRHRYTVYRIPSSPARPVRIVGRELSRGYALKIARLHVSGQYRQHIREMRLKMQPKDGQNG